MDRNIEKRQAKSAFTIVEVTLAMAFLAILLVSISALVIRMTKVYQKGIALKSVNTVGVEIIDDMSRTISNTTRLIPSQEVDRNGDGVINFSEQRDAHNKYFKVRYLDDTKTRQASGAFCTGKFSYVWNTPSAPANKRVKITAPAAAGAAVGEGAESFYPRLARVLDNTRSFCVKGENAAAWANDEELNLIPEIPAGAPLNDYAVELINKDQSDLWIYEMTVQPVIQSPSITKYFSTVSFVLATARGGVNIMANGDYCRGKGNENSMNDSEFNNIDLDYCAVNKFSFSVQTGGTGSLE